MLEAAIVVTCPQHQKEPSYDTASESTVTALYKVKI